MDEIPAHAREFRDRVAEIAEDLTASSPLCRRLGVQLLVSLAPGTDSDGCQELDLKLKFRYFGRWQGEMVFPPSPILKPPHNVVGFCVDFDWNRYRPENVDRDAAIAYLKRHVEYHLRSRIAKKRDGSGRRMGTFAKEITEEGAVRAIRDKLNVPPETAMANAVAHVDDNTREKK